MCKRMYLMKLVLWLLVSSSGAIALWAGEMTPESQVGQAKETSINADVQDQSTATSSAAVNVPHLYDLTFHLEVEGQIALMSTTRYYRYQDIHLKARAEAGKGQYKFDSVRLVTENDELNYGVGEGPKRHQRYILLSETPSQEIVSRINRRIVVKEKENTSLSDRSLIEDDKAEKGKDPDEEEPIRGKKAFFNYYLWKNPCRGFCFFQSHDGSVPCVENRAEVESVLKEGGKKANPRFFETLQYALLAIPPFIDSSGRQNILDSSWEVHCRPIMEGLVDLCREVYGRKMTLLEPESLEAQTVHYVSHRVSGTTIVRILGTLDNATPTSIRVSGFKGNLWIQSFRREVFFDTAAGRILKDHLQIDFGIQRDTKILAVQGQRNRVQIMLVDQCFLGCPDSDTEIALAANACIYERPEL